MLYSEHTNQTGGSCVVLHLLLWFFFFPGHGYKGICADPDSKGTVFNNRNSTLSGAGVWIHCLRQSCLNITLTPPVPWWGAPSHCLHSSYFYWKQEETVSEYRCVPVCPSCVTLKLSGWEGWCTAGGGYIDFICVSALVHACERKYYFSNQTGWVVRIKTFLDCPVTADARCCGGNWVPRDPSVAS